MTRGILIVALDFSAVQEDEFHDWYDLEHLPERQHVQGFGACERWIGVDDPKHSVATYDLDSLDVLDSAPYRAIAHDNLSVWSKRVTAKCERLLRFEGQELGEGDKPRPRRNGRLVGECDEHRTRPRGGLQRLVRRGASAGVGRSSRYPVRSPLPVPGGDPSLRCGLPSRGA